MSTVDPIRTQTLTYFLRPGDPAPARPTALYLALFTADPGANGAATNELTASGYARQPITFDPPADGETQDAAAVTFGPAGSGGWPQITHVAVCAGATAGLADLLYVGALQTSQTVGAGQSLRFDASEITVAAGSAAVSGAASTLAASGTRLFSYMAGDSLAGATVSRGSVATYRDVNGVLQTAAADVARDAHYEGVTRTLLLEGAATNLLLDSEQFELSPPWIPGRATISADAASAPDGQLTADLLIEDMQVNGHNVSQDLTGTVDNQIVTFSAFVHAAGRSMVTGQIVGRDGQGGSRFAWFDLATGTWGTVQSGISDVWAVPYADGWYRLGLTANLNAGTATPYVLLATATSDGVYGTAGDGASGLDLWGGMATVGSLRQSYAASGTSAGTRAADLVAFQYAFAPQESSGLVRFVELGSAAVVGSGVFYLGNDAATGPRLWIDATGSGYRLVHDNGATEVVSTSAATPAMGDAVALRWVLYADGSVELFQSVNGGAETTGGRSAANVLAAAWGGQTLRLNSVGTVDVGLAAYAKCVVDAGVQSLATLDTAALPATPSALSATANGTMVTLSWTDNATNETGFYIYRKYTSPDGAYTDPDWVLVNPDEPVPADTPDFDDPGLQVGATYQYQVTAFNSVGESAPSNSVSITISAIPAAPTDLAATVSGTTVTLAWTDNSNNEDGFHIYRKYTSPDGTYTDPNWVLVTPSGLAVNTTSYADTGLAAGATYHYYIAAFNSAGESAPSNTVDITIPPTGGGVPAAPTDLTATAISASRIDLTWTDNATDETGYEMHRSTVSGFTPSSSTLVQTLATGAQTWSDQTVAASTTYYYRVLAVNDFGPSDPSNQATATTPAAPTSADYTNQPGTTPTTVIDADFSSLTSGGVSETTTNHLSVVSDATAPKSPPDVLQITYPTGFHEGSAPSTIYTDAADGATEVFYAMHWKCNSNWQFHCSGVSKIGFIFFNNGQHTNGGQDIIMMHGLSVSSAQIVCSFENANQEAHGGTTNYYGNTSNDPHVTPGNWYKIEWWYKKSSTGSSDGAMKVWLDGALILDYTNIPTGDTTIEECQISPTWGGVGCSVSEKTQTDYYRIDHWFIARN